MGVVPADQLLEVPDGTRVLVAGAVTHRQRPATAQGVTFINLEDETGMVNVLCSPGVWSRHRRLAQTASALLIRGRCRTPPARSPSSPTGSASSACRSAPAVGTSAEPACAGYGSSTTRTGVSLRRVSPRKNAGCRARMISMNTTPSTISPRPRIRTRPTPPMLAPLP